jgi:hypothetical protein
MRTARFIRHLTEGLVTSAATQARLMESLYEMGLGTEITNPAEAGSAGVSPASSRQERAGETPALPASGKEPSRFASH